MYRWRHCRDVAQKACSELWQVWIVYHFTQMHDLGAVQLSRLAVNRGKREKKKKKTPTQPSVHNQSWLMHDCRTLRYT
jgi:hypothetical protein